MTITGTCHFYSTGAAVRYYSDYYNSLKETLAAVNQKIADKEIAIGPPAVKAGETLALNDERRYIITTK